MRNRRTKFGQKIPKRFGKIATKPQGGFFIDSHCTYLMPGPTHLTFLARDSMLSVLYAIANPSVRLSVRPSHGWISRKRLKLRSCNFHRTVAPSL